MASLFWDMRGITHIDFLTEQQTINAEYTGKFTEMPSKNSHLKQV